MASITYSTLDTLLNLSSGVTAATLEEIIDLAIDLLNLYSNADLPNMTGTAGSKTVSVESNQKGAILLVARTVYHSFYKDISPSSMAGISLSPSDLLSNSVILSSVKGAARRLSEPDVDVG